MTAILGSTLPNTAISGLNNLGELTRLSATGEGHLEVAIHDPLFPFGSVHTENMSPVFQSDAVYGIDNSQQRVTNTGSGTATGTNGLFEVSTGTTIYSFGTIQSRKRLRYRSGQGSICRFTAMFPSNAANSILVAGLGHAEDGFFVGYNGTSFGVLHSKGGVRECRTLTITTASSTAENITITLNSVAFTVPVTNSANIQRTVYEIASFTYAGWTAQAVGATIVFLSASSGARSGTYSITATTANGTYGQTKAGVAATDTWVTQANWNGDPLDGTGDSGVTIDPTKLNVFEIAMQYLGAGAVQIKCEVCPSNSNNPTWAILHTFRFPNSSSTPLVGNPSMPFTMAAYSAGSTTNLSVKCASYAGGIEGGIVRHGNGLTYEGVSTAVGSATYRALFSIANSIQYNNRSNQSVINLISIGGAVKHTQPVTIYIIRNGTLAGNPNFASYSTSSVSLFDNAATTVTYNDNNQVIRSFQLAETGDFNITFPDEVTLQPGEILTVCAKSVTGTPAYVLASLNTREDK